MVSAAGTTATNQHHHTLNQSRTNGIHELRRATCKIILALIAHKERTFLHIGFIKW